MIILDATTRSLEVDLTGAVATNQLPFVASYVDINQSTFAMSAASTNTGATNSTTAVTLVAAPGATTSRQLKYLSIKNSDTASVELWVQLNDNTTLREIWKGTLAVGDSLIYLDSNGFVVVNSSGQIKTTAAPTFTATRVPFAGSDTNLTSDSGFTFDTTGDILTVGAINVAGSTAPTSGWYLPSADLIRTPNSVTIDDQLVVSGGTFRVSSSGLTFINDDSNANMVLGLTINQGGADTEILALKSSDVAHGITTQAETDTWAKAQKYGATDGGVHLFGLSGGTVGAALTGIHTTDNTTKTTGGLACIEMSARLKSGTTHGVCGADANLLAIKNLTTTRFIFDAEGSAHADVEWIAFDRYDDLALLNGLDHEFMRRRGEDPIKAEFGQFLDEKRAILQRERIVNFYDDGPRAMVNFTRLSMLHTGAIRQLGNQLSEVRVEIGRLQAIEARLNQLEAR